MKKFLIPLFLLVSSALSAADWGGSLINFTRFKGKKFSDLKLDQTDDFRLWVKVPFDKDGNIYWTAEGLYEFEYDGTIEEYYNRLDLSLFKLAAKVSAGDGLLSINAGRFMFGDLTGLVYVQPADGAYIEYENSTLRVSAYGAYTGLLNAQCVKILDNPAEPFVYDTKTPYDPAAKYAVGAATLGFPNLFANQTIAAQFLGAFKIDGKNFNRMYGTLSLGGPLYRTFFYSASTTFSFRNTGDDSYKVSNLSKAKFSLYLPYKSLALNAGLVYASGKQGSLETFGGFTKVNAYNGYYDPQYAGLLKGEFSFSIKPVENLMVYGSLDTVFNAADDSIKYKGLGYSAGAKCQVFSDVMLGLGIFQYIDNDSEELNNVQISLNASLVF